MLPEKRLPAWHDHAQQGDDRWPMINGFSRQAVLSWLDRHIPNMSKECDDMQGWPIGLCKSISADLTWRVPGESERYFYPIALHWWLNSTRWDRTVDELWEHGFHMDPRIIADVACKRCIIVLHNHWEGWDAQRWLEIMQIIMRKYPTIGMDDFVVVSNNLAIQPPMRSVGLAFFQQLIQGHGHHADIESLHEHVVESISSDRDRPYRFLCMNRRPSPARWALMTMLFEDRHNGLLSFGVYTDLSETKGVDDYALHYRRLVQQRLATAGTMEHSSRQSFQHSYPKQYSDYVAIDIEPHLPLIIDDKVDLRINPNADGSTDKFLSSYLHIISETYMDGGGLSPGDIYDRMHFSEKTFKPIWYLQPFVLCGQRHALRFLRDLGYGTFGRWIDETYDDIENDSQRLIKAVASARQFFNRSNDQINRDMREMLPTLKYNYECLCINAEELPGELYKRMSRLLI